MTLDINGDEDDGNNEFDHSFESLPEEVLESLNTK
jgi:hypothetical protein